MSISSAITANLVKKLLTTALRGDAVALAELKKINRTVSKVANSRLFRLEKSEFDFYAYDKAESYLNSIGSKSKSGMPRYPEGAMGAKLGNKKSIRDLERNIQSALEFNKAETSTVTGHRKVQERRIQEFKDKGIDIPVEDREKFLRFLGTDSVQTIGKVLGYDSKQVVETIRGAREKGFTYQGIKNMFDELKENKSLTLDDVLNRLKSKVVKPNMEDFDSVKEYEDALREYEQATQRNNKSTYYQRKRR